MTGLLRIYGDLRKMNNIKAIFLFSILSAFTCVPGQAQTDNTAISLGYRSTANTPKRPVINPHIAGSRGALSTFMSYRLQWIGISGAPVFQTISLNAPTKTDKVGLV